MLANKGKITVRQALILFVLATFSPSIRLFTAGTARGAESAAWLTPILSALVMIVVFKILSSIFRNRNITNLGVFFDRALGKALGRTVLVQFLLWLVVLYFVYIRYYTERLIMTIFTGSETKLFIIVLMLLVFMATRGKIESFARFGEFSFIVFTVVFITFFLFLIPGVRIDNIWPVTHFDAIPVVKSSYNILSIWGYVTFSFFLGDRIADKEKLGKYTAKTIIYLASIATLTIVTVIGTLGPSLVARMPIPFFSALTTISIMETLDRLEPFLLSTYVMSDFIVVVFFAQIIIAVLKELFKVSETRYLSTPIAFAGYAGSQFLASSRFELGKFSTVLGLWVNVVLCIAAPAVIFIVGKIRKKI